MAVKMRLRRMGQKKAPFYRVVVADERSPRDGSWVTVPILRNDWMYSNTSYMSFSAGPEHYILRNMTGHKVV